jgi:F-type H+-transporting ATPase subunit b
MPPLVPDVPLLVFSLVLFWVFLWAARRFAWLPLIRGLDAREGRVNRALAEADAARKMAEQLLHDHEVRMAGVTEQVKGIVAEARHQAEQTRASMIASAEAEAARIRDAAIADVQAARGQVLSELESILDSQVAEATEQILR